MRLICDGAQRLRNRLRGCRLDLVIDVGSSKLLYFFLGASTKFWKVITSLVMPVRLSVRMEQTRLPPEGFYDVLYLRNFWNYVQKLQDSLKSEKNNGYFTWRHM
jgi:hypothetical protein